MNYPLIHKIRLWLTLILIVLPASLAAQNTPVFNIPPVTQEHIQLLQQSLVPLKKSDDYNGLIEQAADEQFVLIGDSTHGTHEFYAQRIEISKRLIKEKNFKLVALEGDWPNVYVLNQYIQSSEPLSLKAVLNVFNPHATWLWNNQETFEFIQWLKEYNQQLPQGEQKISLLGMDIYSFEQSIKRVIHYLGRYSQAAAQLANKRYQCFRRFNLDLHRYGKAVRDNPLLSCEQAVYEQYNDFSDCRIPCPDDFSFIDSEVFFDAMQNARVVKNTEKSLRRYYQTGHESSMWNDRDRHMMETLDALMHYLNNPKTVIWAHSSHLGDARMTEMAHYEQLNLGQLLRENYKQQVFSIGLLTYSGEVMAADDHNKPARIQALLPAHSDSNEALFHQLGVNNFILQLRQSPALIKLLNQPRLQRHVGVVYRQDEEFDAHYTHTFLADQFDAVIFLDRTSATQKLEREF